MFCRSFFLSVTIKMSSTSKHRHGATAFEEITISLFPFSCKGLKKKRLSICFSKRTNKYELFSD